MAIVEPTITQAQFDVLEKQNEETLCLWYCMINTWTWPKELPDDPYPLVHDRDERMRLLAFQPRRVTCVILDWITGRVGRKAVSRYWNVVFNKHMTEESFQEWWLKEKEGK